MASFVYKYRQAQDDYEDNKVKSGREQIRKVHYTFKSSSDFLL